MTKHIGIVACSAEGAELCYRTICAQGSRHLGPHAHPEVSMDTHSFADYVACLVRRDIAGIGDLMLPRQHDPSSDGPGCRAVSEIIMTELVYRRSPMQIYC